MFVFVFQDFYDEQGVFSESFWPQSEPPQAMAFNPRGRVNKPLTPPPTTQAINNQVSASVKFMRGVLGSKINGLVSSVELKVRAFCITKVAFLPGNLCSTHNLVKSRLWSEFQLKIGWTCTNCFICSIFKKCVKFSSGEHVLYVQVVKPYLTNITN